MNSTQDTLFPMPDIKEAVDMRRYKIKLLYHDNYGNKEKTYPAIALFAVKRTIHEREFSRYFTKRGGVFKNLKQAQNRAKFLKDKGFITEIIEHIGAK